MVESEKKEIVIFLDQGTIHIKEEDCHNFIALLPEDLKRRYFLKKLFIFPPVFESMEIKDWQIVNFIGYCLFHKNNGHSRLATDKKARYYFLTRDKKFILDAREGYQGHSKSRKLPAGISLEKRGDDGLIIFTKKIFDPNAKRNFPFRIEVHVLFIPYADNNSRPQKIKTLFKRIEEML